MRTVRSWRLPLILLIGLCVNACGGGDGGGTSAPSALSYPPAPPFVVGEPIKALTPKVTGTVTTYSVSPALPAGLSLDSSTGVISGTPGAVSASNTYTVKAANAAGGTSAGLSIVVTNVAAANIYPSPYYTFTAGEGGVDYVAVVPTIYGGFPISSVAVPNVSWAVSPALPAGLTFNAQNGSISGIPTSAGAAASYLVTATNAAGSYSMNLTIEVSPAGPLLDLGQSGGADLFGFNGSQLLSRDGNAHWKLFDYVSGSVIASGFSDRAISLVGPTIMIGKTDGLELRAALDGHVLSTVTFPVPGAVFWYKLAQDGSYVVAGTNTVITAWSLAGNVLLSHSGDYSHAIVFAAPGAVQIGLGPAGQNVVESISIATGTSTVSAAFTGAFAAWFSDGTRFVTTQLQTVSVYTLAGVQLAQVTPPAGAGQFGGYGNWFWTFGSCYGCTAPLTIYAVGNSAAPAATYTGGYLVASGSTLGLFSAQGSSMLSVIDLSGAAPAKKDYTTPIGDLGSYAATSASTWLVGNGHGVILDGAGLPAQPRYLTQGDASSIAGSPVRFAVATASGRILYYNAATLALEGTIDFPSTNLLLSTDGTVLAAAATGQSAVNVYSLPAGTLANSISGQLLAMAQSGSGTVLALATSGNPGCDTELVPALGGPTIWCQLLGPYQQLRLSPDGTHVATAQSPAVSGTNLYQNTQLVATLPGWGVGWINNNQLLVNNYVAGTGVNVGTIVYNGSTIYDATGAVVSSPPLPEIDGFQPLSADSIFVSPLVYPINFSPPTGAIVSPSTGATLWASGTPLGALSAIAGHYVIFDLGSSILAESVP